MRIFKFWMKYSRELSINGIKQLSTTYGGSNISEDEAIKDAILKLNNAQKRINGELGRNRDYEADIREEIIETLNQDNIITRNRYGALVLNSKKLMFIDIDEYSSSVSDLIFRRSYSQKQLMLRKIEKTAQKKDYHQLGFRIYETAKGYRVLVTNKDFDPRSYESKRMMRDFNADHLYRWLCRKQNCYRARLTPKPHRINLKRIKVIFPNRTAVQQQELTNWLHEYELKSQRSSSCHLVKEIGQVRTNEAIEYHDRLSGVKWEYNLA